MKITSGENVYNIASQPKEKKSLLKRSLCPHCSKSYADQYKFEKFWLKYVVVDLESDVHGERLLECVIDFNSSNI